MLQTSIDMVRVPVGTGSPGAVRALERLRYQLLAGLLLAVVLPTATYHFANLGLAFRQPSSLNTIIGASFAYVMALYLYRRVATFPGVGALGYVMPAVVAAYGLVLALFFALRLDYSRFNFGVSLAISLGFLFLLSLYLRQHARENFYVVPSDHALTLVSLPGADWTVLSEPQLPAEKNAIIIADLRADMEEAWERLIAEAALKGLPVYHSKQVQESLTGRVEIEHLSENSFGSLIPNSSYRKIKRLLDVLTSLALLPLLVPLGFVVAALIKLDSPGPVFFRQRRLGHRGKIFHVLKFRTMEHASHGQHDSPRQAAITQARDSRITRVGQFLRRTRIDELPQILNVLRGEMSWIGPRPEALPLSEWYMGELPFYSYRHILRPGITGWAQVNQGHVADLEAVLEKLHYDFFYIKHFSGWLDLLILWRTLGIVISGFGAR
jgi:lipopolysaccharide/colanic/teichoic acid biosynthesis glycosyltransferase